MPQVDNLGKIKYCTLSIAEKALMAGIAFGAFVCGI